MMVCPRCGSDLKAEMIGRTQVEGCDSCGGLWFDAMELQRVARGGREAVSDAEEIFEPPPAGAERQLAEAMCPRCNVELYEFEMRHSAGITLDACPQCKGIWVDDQELEAIAERMKPSVGARSEKPTVRRRARCTLSFMQRVVCHECGEENYGTSLSCWACGTTLHLSLIHI